jgi:ribulose-phosphate 3-epimerase
MPSTKIAPSLLSANFARLAEQIKMVERGKADWLHLDIMDGHFVPNITFGPLVVRSIRPITKLPLDAHLMVENPDQYLDDFREAGVDHITVHVEGSRHLHRTIQKIKKLGLKAGVSLNPATPAISLREILPFVDQVLVMSVNPGFGGQSFIRQSLRKIQEIVMMAEAIDKVIDISVDGGVDERNASEIVSAGATVLVAGFTIFSKKNIPQAVKNLRSAVTAK